MNAPVNPKELELQTVEFKLDGQTIVSYEGETILKAAKRHGIDIPHLCQVTGDTLVAQETREDALLFTIRKA